MSENPKHPQGVNQFSHELWGFDEYESLIRKLMNDDHRKVDFFHDSILTDVRHAIIDRLE